MRLKKRMIKKANTSYSGGVKPKYLLDGQPNWNQILEDLLISANIEGGIVGESGDETIEDMEDEGYEINGTLMDGVTYARSSLDGVLKSSIGYEQLEVFVEDFNHFLNTPTGKSEIRNFCRESAYGVSSIFSEYINFYVNKNELYVGYEYSGY